MHIPTRYSRWLVILLCVTLVLQLAACGTLIHPERRGQTGGRIDPAIAVLDGIGLLFFLIPGLIAYAVDFSTGAIYLPPGDSAKATGEDGGKMRVIYVDPEELDAETIERVIEKHTGLSVDLDEEYVEAYRYDNRDVMLQEMAKANRTIGERQIMAHAVR